MLRNGVGEARACTALCSAASELLRVPYAETCDWTFVSCVFSWSSGCCSTAISLSTIALTSSPEPMPGEESVGIVANPSPKDLPLRLAAQQLALQLVERLGDLQHFLRRHLPQNLVV